MQELKKPPSGRGTESGEKTASNWKWYEEMDLAIGGKPSITPPSLVASAWENSPISDAASSSSTSTSSQISSPDSVPAESPVPAKKRRDGVLEFLEKADERDEARAKRDEAREERMLSLLEKIVEKM